MLDLFSGCQFSIKPFAKTIAEPSEQVVQGPPNPLNLSIVTQFYPPDYAATGQFIQELAHQFSRLGLQVQIFTGQPGYAFDRECANAPAVERSDRLLVRRSRLTQIWAKRVRGKALNGLLFCLRAGFQLLQSCWRGDVLLLTTAPPFLPILGYLANLCFGTPYVCLLYDLYPDVTVELKVVSKQHWIVKLWDALNRKVWQNATGIIVLSSTMKARVVAKCPEVEERVSVIHSWADPDWIRPMPKSDNWFARKYQLAHRFTVLYSGNLGRCHEIETMLGAIEALKNEPMQFVFIGDGANRKLLATKVKALGLNNCLFLPYQDKEVLPFSLTAADLSLVSIAPGLEGVVAPSKLYGMLAAGRPIAAICESQSYLRPLIADAKCGETFEHGDSVGLAEFIRTLAANPKQAETMGRDGRRYLKRHFTPERIAQQYVQVLQAFAPIDTLEIEPRSTESNLEQKQGDRRTFLTSWLSRRFRQSPPAYPLLETVRLPLGQLLKQAGLLSDTQVQTVLEIQRTTQHSLRFGDILVQQGLLKPETIDFIAEYSQNPVKKDRQHPLGYYLKSAKLLDDRQIKAILDEQHQTHLRFGEVAVRFGWVKQETIDFVLSI
jgi:glycosyltransferase involved in cell wall biosynthesis